MRRSPFCAIWLLCCILSVDPAQAQLDSLIASWAEFSDDNSELIETLQELYDNPVDINRAGPRALSVIPFLSAARIDSIIKVRQLKGRFKSKRELRPVLGAELYGIVRHFIVIRKRARKKGVFIQRTAFPVEQPEQITNNTFQGNAVYNYTRAQYWVNNNLKIGFVTQKDTGEKLFFDYINGYVETTAKDWRCIAGNYYLHFGRGLTFSNPFGTQKSAMAMMPFRASRNGAAASLSSAENFGHFGLLAEGDTFLSLHLHLFMAVNLRDGRISSRTGALIGIDYDGYHRTRSETERMDLVKEQLLGLAVQRKIGQKLEIGLLLARFRFSPQLSRGAYDISENERRRQYFQFSGSRLNQFSVFYHYGYKQLSVDGEFAVSDAGSPGFEQSFMFDFDKISAGLKTWKISNNFQSAAGRIFDSSDPFPQAVQGVYGALSLKPFKSLKLNAYKLVRKDLWRSYFNPMPLAKDEWLVQADYKHKAHLLTVRVRHKNSPDFAALENGPVVRNPLAQKSWRIQWELHPSKKIRLRSRWENTRLSPETETGTTVFQDIRYRAAAFLEVSGRLTFFRSDTYNSRIYEYETDLPGSFSNWALYGQGLRWYVLMKARFSSRFIGWLKIRYLYRSDDDLTDVDYRNQSQLIKRDIRFQLQINL